MNTLILGLAMVFQPMPERAWFRVEMDTNTIVSISINDQPIVVGRQYKTEPLTESVCLEVKVKYICGDVVKERIFWMDLDPGDVIKYKITLHCRPPLLVCT